MLNILLILAVFLFCVWVAVEIFRALRAELQKPNPVYQETCWLCHRVLGNEAYLYRLAKSTHRIVCPRCALSPKHIRSIEHHYLLDKGESC